MNQVEDLDPNHLSGRKYLSLNNTKTTYEWSVNVKFQLLPKKTILKLLLFFQYK